jgi:hypothetical protein
VRALFSVLPEVAERVEEDVTVELPLHHRWTRESDEPSNAYSTELVAQDAISAPHTFIHSSAKCPSYRTINWPVRGE